MDLFSNVMVNKEMTNEIIRFFTQQDIYSNFNNSNYTIIPGFCDVHVHFREPGFVYKETVLSGSKSAARGGYTAVCTMPNLNPVPDTLKNINLQIDAINKANLIAVYPYSSITMEQKGKELSELLKIGYPAVAFSDDGKGIQSEDIMLQAMETAKKNGSLIVAHCEDNSLLNGGYIHDGEYAKKAGHKGISSESEYRQIERDINLAKQTGCSYHVCHISTKESVDLIRKAKENGVDITCETAPHYLFFNDMDLQEQGRFKMNPPIRSEKDRIALIEGIVDGTIDMIATDHAPHSLEEKSAGLEKSLFGVVGLETAFPSLYTKLVMEKIISLEKLIELLCYNPRKRFKINSDLGFSVWDLNKGFTVKSDDFLSAGKSTPFEGINLFGENNLTVYNGRVVYEKVKES